MKIMKLTSKRTVSADEYNQLVRKVNILRSHHRNTKAKLERSEAALERADAQLKLLRQLHFDDELRFAVPEIDPRLIN